MNGDKKDRKYFLIFCCLSIVLVGIIFSLNSIMKSTSASFGGITGELTVTYKVTYYANWPDDSMEEASNVYNGKKIYQVLGNMYDVPSGYEFLGWGTEPNGLVVYNEGDVINLSKEISLYAIWGLVEENEDGDKEEIVITYGDTNLDGVVDENDYLLIDSYILDNSVLSGEGLINADVNVDGKVDQIDSDIIRQAFLGTLGYVGFLPDKPILIYELYVKDESNDGENDTTGEDNDNVGGNTSSSGGNGSSGTGGGTTGSGNSNSGSGTGGKKPSGGSNNKPSSNTSSSDEGNEKPKEEEKPEIYEFKFINDNVEYAITKCDILQDGTCKLIFPSTIPSKRGFMFRGWSLDEDCSKHIIKETMDVNSSATYYACYIEIKEKTENKNNYGMWILVGGIWILVSRLIYHVIKHFKDKNGNN